MNDELRHVLSHYSLGKFKNAWRVERGFVNENWIVETSQGRYFLKRRHPDLRDSAVVAAQHALIAYLRRAGFPVPVILPITGGATLLVLDEEFYEMQEYIECEPYDHDRPAHFREAAQTLGRYHAFVQGFTSQALEQSGLYSPALLRANLARLADGWSLERHPALARIARQLESHADDLEVRFAWHGPLPHLVIHGDYYAGNLLFAGDRIVGVVDYDKARWQPRAVELAEALIYFASPRPGHLRHLVYPGFLQWNLCGRFLHGYARVVALDEREVHALPDYVRCIWLQVALQRLWERGPRPAWAQEALQEALALGEWAKANARQMIALALECWANLAKGADYDQGHHL
jgi:homoserine kinase type II